MRSPRILLFHSAIALSLLVMPYFTAAHAHDAGPARVAADQQPAIFKNIGIEQRLGAQVPGQTEFRDDSGARVTLQQFFSDKPALLLFTYFDCPMLCPLVLDGVVRSLKPLSLDVARDFNVIVISIDERDSADAAHDKKNEYAGRYARPGTLTGWHFLTGDKDAIEQVTRAVGFNYAYDEARQEYVHASGLFTLTPGGKIARVLYGIDYLPRDVRLALVEAAQGQIGTVVDQFLLYCYHYDPTTGKYGWAVMSSLRIAGLATVLAIAAYLIVMLRREHHGSGDFADV
jgi:protein SCO1